MTQPTPAPTYPFTYLIGFFADGGQLGNSTMTFHLPVTEDDLPMVIRKLTEAGYDNPIILSVSRLAPKRAPEA
jgi:hypothetical protein